MNQKLIVNPWGLKQFNFIRTVPCFHIDPQNVTVTSMVLEENTQLKETDKILTKEECLELISSRVPGFDDDFFASKEYLDIKNSDPHGITIVPKNNSIVYDDLVVKYQDFPGQKNPVLENFNVHLRLKVKTNMHISKIYPVDRNFCVYLRYLNTDEHPWLKSTGGMLQTKLLPQNQPITDSLIPTLICRINKGEEPNLHNLSDFVIFSSQPGYYCNLPLVDVPPAEFFENDFNGIVVDSQVRKPLMESIAERITPDEEGSYTSEFVKTL